MFVPFMYWTSVSFQICFSLRAVRSRSIYFVLGPHFYTHLPPPSPQDLFLPQVHVLLVPFQVLWLSLESISNEFHYWWFHGWLTCVLWLTWHLCYLLCGMGMLWTVKIYFDVVGGCFTRTWLPNSSNFCFARLLFHCKVHCIDLELILLDMSSKEHQIWCKYIEEEFVKKNVELHEN